MGSGRRSGPYVFANTAGCAVSPRQWLECSETLIRALSGSGTPTHTIARYSLRRTEEIDKKCLLVTKHEQEVSPSFSADRSKEAVIGPSKCAQSLERKDGQSPKKIEGSREGHECLARDANP